MVIHLLVSSCCASSCVDRFCVHWKWCICIRERYKFLFYLKFCIKRTKNLIHEHVHYHPYTKYSVHFTKMIMSNCSSLSTEQTCNYRRKLYHGVIYNSYIMIPVLCSALNVLNVSDEMRFLLTVLTFYRIRSLRTKSDLFTLISHKTF